jgi:hypothetical protein
MEIVQGHAIAYWLRHYITIYLILPAALVPMVFSASNRDEYQRQKQKLFLAIRARSVLKANINHHGLLRGQLYFMKRVLHFCVRNFHVVHSG